VVVAVPRSQLIQSVKALGASIAFIALGLFTRWANGPAIVVWIALGLGVTGAIASIVGMVRPHPPARGSGGEPRVVLKDGRDYRVDVTDDDVVLTHLPTGEAKRMQWRDVTNISIVAIDNWPVGGISFVLARDGGVLEIPWDARNNEQLLQTMQLKYPDLDNEAIIASSGMLHGFKQVWQRPVAAG
jgi:hypothetical protein